MERTLKLKNFYDLTEEDLQEQWEKDMQAIKEGRTTPLEEFEKELEEKYGI